MRGSLRSWLFKIDNLVLYLAGCFLAGSGLMLTYRLLPGSRGGSGETVLGLSRHEWGDWHFYMGLVAIAATVLHLFLNWKWLTKVAGAMGIWRLIVGLALGGVLIAGPLLLPMAPGSDSEDDHDRGFGKGRGRMQQNATE